MPAAPPPPGPRPAWYRRLPPSLQRVAAASDRVTSLPLRAGPGLRESAAALQDVLLSEQVTAVEAVAQQIADDICRALGVPRPRVCVQGQRPHDARGELHGLYLPVNGSGRDRITLWMRTAKRGR